VQYSWAKVITVSVVPVFLAAQIGAAPKPVPAMQALPLPDAQISFQRNGAELTRYHFDPRLRRPFLYPVIGPSGRSLTRMGHPHDPVSHSHHNSIWISHASVDGVSFWDDRAAGQILHQRVEKFEDGEAAAALVVNSWATSNKVVLTERRFMTIRPLPRNEWLLIIDLHLEPKSDSVTFGKTPFGLVGVRMAKTIGVHDGGGQIRNSEGGINETNVLWKRARWVDYSGPIAPRKVEGIALMDHPSNPNHPTYFHVRNDGWMGTSLTYAEPRTVLKGQGLKLRYGFYIHGDAPTPEALESRWREFRDLPVSR
jgi:hypothetical protein